MGLEKQPTQNPELGSQGGGQANDAANILNQENEAGKSFAGMTDKEFKKQAAIERLKIARDGRSLPLF